MKRSVPRRGSSLDRVSRFRRWTHSNPSEKRFLGRTVMLTVAVLESSALSLARKVKLLMPAVAVSSKLKLPSRLTVALPVTHA